jgi:DNA polymerase (family 10)
MQNAEIAKVFLDIAELLKLKKDNSIEELAVPVEQLVAGGRLREIPGVGEAITKKITELVTTGRLAYYERLKAEIQEGANSNKGQ